MSRGSALPAGPLSGWVVLLVSDKFWRASSTPAQLRALGARIVRKPCPGLTHVGMPHEPTPSVHRDVAELFLNAAARELIAEAQAYVAQRRLPVRFVGPLALQQAVRTAESELSAAREARLDAERARIATALARAPTPGFVGI